MDNQQTPRINEAKLTEDQRQQLELYYQTKRQLTALKDIADMVQDISTQLDDKKPLADMGVLLTDIRESLASLNAKEAPGSPDYAKPVVEAVTRLKDELTAAIKAIDVKPEIKLGAPHVNVSPPSVDLKGVEAVMKEMPKAFEAAIKLIPQPEMPKTDFQPLLDAWQGISEQLASIDMATRMKPQAPTQLKVVNPDGSDVRSPSIFREYDDIEFSDADANGNYQTIVFKSNNNTWNTLALTFDANNKVTNITRS